MSLLARIRTILATHERDPEPVADTPDEAVPTPEPQPKPESEAAVMPPPHREHLYGSTYRVRMNFAELMAERGRTGTAAAYRRSLAPRADARRDAQRDAGAGRLGYAPGEVLWPPE